MKSNNKVARAEAKALIIKLGYKNILNKHITEVVERTGVSYCDMQNAFSYFNYSPAQEKFRAQHF